MASRKDAADRQIAGFHRTELCIDPGDEIAVGDIAHEQEQAVGHLVQVAVAQRLARQWAGGDVARLSAGAASFTVLTVVEPPITAELGAGGVAGQAGPDARPARLAMALHVIVSDAIGDALIAQGLHEPIKQSGGVVPLNGGGKTVLAAAVAMHEKFGLAGQTTNAMQQSDCVIAIGARELLVQSRSHIVRICIRSGVASSDQRHQLALRLSVTVDVPLGCLNRPMAGQQLNVAQ